jgi:hypothetical protein
LRAISSNFEFKWVYKTEVAKKAKELEGCVRRRLRSQCLYKLKTFRVRFLILRGVNKKAASKQYKTGQGVWTMSKRPEMNHAMSKAWFSKSFKPEEES